MRDLLEDWRAFDHSAFQRRLDGLRQLYVEIDGQMLHVGLLRGCGRTRCLLLTHGWPGSFHEHLKVLPLLADPGAPGADPSDAFTVIVPSPPGYGFSGPPPPTALTGRQVRPCGMR